jgi:UDP-glucose 4-epimerase
MKTVLVTGIAGFLGSHVAECLLELGNKVVGIDSLEGGSVGNVPSGAKFIQMDICDEEQIERLFYHLKPEAVIHCAAFASENLSHNCRLHTYRSVVQGSATLVNAAINHGVKVFVSMSSIAVYGHQAPPFHEDQELKPMDPYGAAKLCMERDLIAAHDFHGLNYVIFRPHNIIGTRQSLADSTRNVASIFIRQALKGNPLTVYGDGKQTRSFSPVSYVARVIAASISREDCWNRAYNVGGSRSMEVLWLAHLILAKTQSKSMAVHLPERKEAKHAHSSHERVTDAFADIEPMESIEDCIESMIFEARKHRMPDLKPLPRIEVAANLNPAWKL